MFWNQMFRMRSLLNNKTNKQKQNKQKINKFLFIQRI